MNTEVVMKRELFGQEISQKSKSEFFSATDLVKAGNKWRAERDLDLFDLRTWLSRTSTKEFIKEIEKRNNDSAIIRSRGRGHHTWVHPFLFIDLALAINPRLKVEVYQWIYDELLKYRNSSGDSFKRMSGALYMNQSNKSLFQYDIKKYSNLIKEACGIKEWDDWQSADEKTLELRDKIHDNISLLCDVLKNNDDAVRIGIKKALDEK